MASSRVLIVANRTATDLPLVQAVRRRALDGQAAFHLVVPATPKACIAWSIPRWRDGKPPVNALRARFPCSARPPGKRSPFTWATLIRWPPRRMRSTCKVSTRSSSRRCHGACPGGCGSTFRARFAGSDCLSTTSRARRSASPTPNRRLTCYIDHQVLSHDAYNKFIEDDFLGGQRLNPATDGRPDPVRACARPTLYWAT